MKFFGFPVNSLDREMHQRWMRGRRAALCKLEQNAFGLFLRPMEALKLPSSGIELEALAIRRGTAQRFANFVHQHSIVAHPGKASRAAL